MNYNFGSKSMPAGEGTSVSLMLEVEEKKPFIPAASSDMIAVVPPVTTEKITLEMSYEQFQQLHEELRTARSFLDNC